MTEQNTTYVFTIGVFCTLQEVLVTVIVIINIYLLRATRGAYNPNLNVAFTNACAPISEWIIFAMFESKYQNTTIIQVYAPMNDAEEEEKDFYHQLQSAYNKRKARDLTMVIGDLNTKVGSDNRNWEASMGAHVKESSMRTVKCFVTTVRQMGLLSEEHSSRTRNPTRLHGDPQTRSLRTRLTMWLSTNRAAVPYRTPG